MPRRARNMSASNYMHIIVRGIGKQLLFEDDHDYRYYLTKLELYCMDTDVKVCAYCLMDNHVHLLVKGEAESVILLMKKIGVSYSWYYNKKYERVGHLFQDRYKSDPVNDERYFLKLVHYILHNPVVAGICSRPEKYEYSSASEYILNRSGITDIDHVLRMMDQKVLKDFLIKPAEIDQQKNREDHPSLVKINDKKAVDIITGKLGKSVPVDQEVLKQNIRSFLDKGISMRQISRITALSRTVLYRLLKEQ